MTPAQIRDQQAEALSAYDEIKGLHPSDQEALFELLQRAQQGDDSAIRLLYGLVYEEHPVGVEEFILGKRYMGLHRQINQEKLDLLIEFFKPQVRKFWCAAGKGSGKSFMVSLAMAYEIYGLLCLKRPDLFYLLGPGSKIATVNLSIAKEQARDVIFSEFLGRLDHSPWFAKKYDPQVGRCVFPKNIFALSGGSSAVTYYGYHTKLGSVDEASFLLDREGRSVAEELVEAVLGSLTTRFPHNYKLMVISTLRSEEDFLYTNIQRIKDDGIPMLVTDDVAAFDG